MKSASIAGAAVLLLGIQSAVGAANGMAYGQVNRADCRDSATPAYANVRFNVFDPFTQNTVEVKGVLTEPVEWVPGGFGGGCYKLVEQPPAVVILHGSGGIDSRGAFYTQALQDRYATLAVEMFEGSAGGTGRPPLPIFNYSHAFAALNYLVDAEGFIDPDGRLVSDDPDGNLPPKVPVNPDAVGCLGFSWGGVVCQQVATQPYAEQFGDALYGSAYRFAAHAANYPVCWARNIPGYPGLAFGAPGAPLTGAPILIQVGGEDAYDNAEGQSGSTACTALKDGLTPEERSLLDVVVFDGASHAFDRVYAPSTVVQDPFARLGQYIAADPQDYPDVEMLPDLTLATQSLRNVERFFDRQMGGKPSQSAVPGQGALRLFAIGWLAG